MHLQGLDLNLLIALDALLSEKNVTRAAERIHISQPGMSAALQKLRNYFEDPLLERVGRAMELTVRAKALSEPVKAIISSIRDLNESMQDFDSRNARRVFRISATTYCSEIIATPLLNRLQERAPGIGIHFEDLSADTVSRISDGEIDFAITISARIIDKLEVVNESLRSRSLFTDKFVLVMSLDNPFKGETASVDEFCKMRYLETRFAGVYSGVSEQILRQQPRRPQICAWLPNFQLTLDTVEKTDLVSVLPSLLITHSVHQRKIRALPVPFEMPMLEERLFWHTRHDNDPGHQWICRQIGEIVGELGI